jgi:hypothetical protein
LVEFIEISENLREKSAKSAGKNRADLRKFLVEFIKISENLREKID